MRLAPCEGVIGASHMLRNPGAHGGNFFISAGKPCQVAIDLADQMAQRRFAVSFCHGDILIDQCKA